MKNTSEKEHNEWFRGAVVLGMTDDCIIDHICAGRSEKLITQLEYTSAKIANKFIERMVKK